MTIDFHLQLIVTEIPFYVRNTNDFPNKLKTINNIPEATYLISMNVKFFYTNISNSEGIAAAKRALDKKLNKTITAEVITTISLSILTLKNFVSNARTLHR